MAIGNLVVIAPFTDYDSIIVAIIASTAAETGSAKEMVDHHAGDMISDVDGCRVIVDPLTALHHDIFRRRVYGQAIFRTKIHL